MSELKPEAILTFLGFETDKVKSEDDFKSQFEAKFGIKDQLLKDPTFTSKIFGQKIGAVEAKIKSNAKKMGVEFSPEDLKDKGVEEILELSFLKIGELNKKAMDDLEKSTKGTVDDQVKSWKEKYQSVESKLRDTEGLLQKTSSEFEGFKKDAITAQKTRALHQFKQTALGKLEFKQDVTPVERVGFETVLNEKYDFDLDESQSPYIKDRKTGQRIPSKKETGKFMTAEEIFEEELIANKLAKINSQGGKPVDKKITTFTGSDKTDGGQDGQKPLYIHPNARQTQSKNVLGV